MPILPKTNRLNNFCYGTSESIFIANHPFYQDPDSYYQYSTSTNHGNDSLARILENSRLYTTVDLGSHSTQNDALSEHYSCDAISYSEFHHNPDKQSSPNPENKDSESIKYLSEASLNFIYQESDKTMIIVQSISVAATYNDGVQNNLQDDGVQNNLQDYGVQNNSRDEAVGSIEISTKPELCNNIANSGTQEPSASSLPLMTPVSNFGLYRVTSQIVVDGHNF